MSALDSLTQGAAPQTATNSSISQQVLPDWYNQYVQGIAGKATQVANAGYQAYPGQQLADFTPDQLAAQQSIRDSQGNWKGNIAQAGGILNGAMGDVNNRLGQGAQYGQTATQAVAGPAQSWTNNFQQYMSPYTSQVVNEIGRLGNQNLQENLLPSVQNQFLGSGQFGSTRNADILGRTVRDTQAGITGQQSNALQSGYGTSAGIFANDANRQQQQQALQAQTNLGAGNLSNSAAGIGANAATGIAGGLSGLAAQQSNLSAADAQRLAASGAQQQGLAQQGLDLNYQNFQNQANYDRNQVGYLSGALNGLTIPMGQVNTNNTSGPSYGTSPLQWINSLYGTSQSPSGGATTANRTTQ